MDILRLYPFLPPCRGGIEFHVSSLSAQQRLLGHDVTVLFNQGAAVHSQDIKIAGNIHLRSLKPQLLRDLLFFTSAFLHCFKKQKRFDVIHIHGDWSAYFFGLLIACLVKPRIRVASMHGEVRKDLRRRFYRPLLSRYNIVYCTGFRETEILRSLGVKHANWQPSGVSGDIYDHAFSYPYTPSHIDIICVANLVPVKNLRLLIGVAQCLTQYRFEVIGDGPLREHLTTICLSLGINNVHFSGALSHSDLAIRLASAKIFYLPSLTEGTPTAMLEAMAVGLPVVVTPSNDYRDLIQQGINGFVTPDFTVESSVNAISDLINNPTLMSSISKQNRLVGSRFTWLAVAKRITVWMQGTSEHEH